MIFECKSPSWVVEVANWFNSNLIDNETVLNVVDYLTKIGIMKCSEISGIVQIGFYIPLYIISDMGIQITAKFNGNCKMCGNTWRTGEQVWYQKTPKAICIEEVCYTEQGGTKDARQTAFKMNDPRSIIITKVPEVRISEDTIMVADLWRQYFRQAHELTKEVYPQEDLSTDRFGMIRQTVLNQLVHMAGVIVNSRNKD